MATNRQALNAQLQFVSKYTADVAANGYTDSDFDYLTGALDLASHLFGANYDWDSFGAGLVTYANQTWDGVPPSDIAPQPVLDYMASLPGIRIP